MPLEFDTSFLGFSPVNAYFLARACQVAYMSEPAKRKAGAAELGLAEHFAPFDVVEEDTIHDYHGFVAANAEMVVLAFRGTDSLQNWLTNITVAQRPAYGGLVHTGFADAMDQLWRTIEPLLQDQQAGTEKDLYITGHSLGGALAVLAAARLQQAGTPIDAVYTYGAPRVGNLDFYLNYQPLTYRVVNNNDIVPHVPPEIVPVGFNVYIYKHVGTLRYFDRHKMLDEGTSDWAIKKKIIFDLLLRNGQPTTAMFEDHHLSAYLEAIKMNV